MGSVEEVELQLTQAIEAARIDGLRELLDTLELERQACGLQHTARTAALHLAALLYENDVLAAKFLWKRLPAELKAESEVLRQLWAVGKAMWNVRMGEPGAVFRALSAAAWPAEVQLILQALRERMWGRTLDLLATAYTKVHPVHVAAHLNVGEADAVAQCQAQGWTPDAESGMLVPPPKAHAPAPHAAASVDMVGQLSQYVSFLENVAMPV